MLKRPCFIQIRMRTIAMLKLSKLTVDADLSSDSVKCVNFVKCVNLVASSSPESTAVHAFLPRRTVQSMFRCKHQSVAAILQIHLYEVFPGHCLFSQAHIGSATVMERLRQSAAQTQPVVHWQQVMPVASYRLHCCRVQILYWVLSRFSVEYMSRTNYTFDA